MNITEVQAKDIARNLVVMGLVTKPNIEEEVIPRFEPIAPTDGHFFDINKNSARETAKVIQEELKTGDLTKRVTNSDMVVTRNGIPQIEFSRYNVHAEAEFAATQNSFRLARECNLIFWISAEDGGKVYQDGRFNIYFRDKIGKEIGLKGKHMPLMIDRFKSLELGKKLIDMGGKTVGEVETVDDLRIQPVGFNLENIDDWISECRKMMPEFAEFWQLFENGDDLRLEAEVEKHVNEAKVIANGDNVVFQKEMARRGFEINNFGSHGSGWLSSEMRMMHNFTIQKINGEYFTKPVLDKMGKLICPVCGEEVSEGATICPKCKINLN